MVDRRNISLADQVYERLEKEILAGSFMRGEVTTETRLSSELGVSRTPVREAIRRLEQENLVRETGKGIMVVGISLEDIKDIMEIRLRLEGLAAQRAAERITDEQLEKLKETLELQEFYYSKKNSDKMKVQDSEFHSMIYEFSGSSVLYNTLAPIHHKLQRYRKAALEDNVRAGNSAAEHWAIYEALKAHDPQLAAEKMTAHVTKVRENLLKEYETWASALQKKS